MTPLLGEQAIPILMNWHQPQITKALGKVNDTGLLNSECN